MREKCSNIIGAQTNHQNHRMRKLKGKGILAIIQEEGGVHYKSLAARKAWRERTDHRVNETNENV